jgi:esterase/lipase superfamily enzyme
MGLNSKLAVCAPVPIVATGRLRSPRHCADCTSMMQLIDDLRSERGCQRQDQKESSGTRRFPLFIHAIITQNSRTVPMLDSPNHRLPQRLFHRCLALLSLSVGGLSLTSCSVTSVNLMPTPLVHQYLGEDAYENLAAEKRTQDINIFYATNRPGVGEGADRQYTNGIVDQMHLGRVTVGFGSPGMQWRDVLDISTIGARKTQVPLTLGETREMDRLPDSDGKTFASAINEDLRRTEFPDITIYVHGAKSSFFRSSVQGAQFHHFMARETAFIAYSWPSTGKFTQYKKDVVFAAQSASRLADLIEYLAANTQAERINILAYSAGGQVAAPGLAQLRKRYPDESAATLRKRFRIGEVFFAAADVGLRKFAVEYLPTFADIVGNVTVTFHKKDFVLGFAQDSHKGESRLGRPDGGELTEAEIRELETLAQETKLDAIDMEYSTGERPVNFAAHGHWYLNEWVSSDAILQFLYGESPLARGLEKEPGTELWYFPPDYPDRLQEIIRKARADGGSE